MSGRARGVAITSATAIEVVKRSLTRTRIIFTVGGDPSFGSIYGVNLRDQENATQSLTGSFPLSSLGAPLVIEGELARHKWTACLGVQGGSCTLGIIEQYEDDPPEEVKEDLSVAA